MHEWILISPNTILFRCHKRVTGYVLGKKQGNQDCSTAIRNEETKAQACLPETQFSRHPKMNSSFLYSVVSAQKQNLLLSLLRNSSLLCFWCLLFKNSCLLCFCLTREGEKTIWGLDERENCIFTETVTDTETVSHKAGHFPSLSHLLQLYSNVRLQTGQRAM